MTKPASELIALADCPFCGSGNISDRHVRDGRQIFCINCGASVAPTFHGPHGDTLDRAKEAWNTRTAANQPGERAGVDALREVLKPFAKMAGAMYVSGHCGGASPEDWPDRWHVTVQGGKHFHTPQQHGGYLTVADFRRAAEALATPPAQPAPASDVSSTSSDGTLPLYETAGGFPVAAAPYQAEETGVIQSTRQGAGVERGMDQCVTGGESAATPSTHGKPLQPGWLKDQLDKAADRAAAMPSWMTHPGESTHGKPDGAVRDDGEIPERETWWLIERRGPSYTKSPDNQPNWTDDPWRAHRFKTAREADNARLRLISHRDESRVVEHIFINKMPAALSPKIAAAETSEHAEELGRFGHHPDPAIDFCIEVECLENEWTNIKANFTNGTPSREEIERRTFSAMQFRVGGDIGAANAKAVLRKIEEEMRSSAIDHLDVKAEAKSQEPDAWQWRFKQQGQWSRWIDLLPDHVDSFRQIQSHNLKSGNCETRPLYTHPTTKPEAPAVGVDAIEVVKLFMTRMDSNGQWDDGCFYYNRYSASELQEPIRRATALIAGGR